VPTTRASDRPLTAAEVVEVEQPAFRRGEQELRVEPRREHVECGRGTAGERHLSAAGVRLAELDDDAAALEGAELGKARLDGATFELHEQRR